MGSMKDILEFDKQLHSITETKPPVSASKIAALTKMAMKQTKLAKHIVHSVEKFIQKCPVDYRLSGLYVIDGITRAAQKGTEPEANHFLVRFEERLTSILPHLTPVNEKDKDRTKRLLALWKKGAVFDHHILDTCESLVESGAEAVTEKKVSAPSRMSERDPRRRLRKDSPVASGTTAVDTSSVLSALTALTSTSGAPVTAAPGLNAAAAALLPLLQAQQTPPATVKPPPNPLLSALSGQGDSAGSNPLAALLANIPGIANISGINNPQQQAPAKSTTDFDYEEEDGQQYPKFKQTVALPLSSADTSRRQSDASSGGLVGNTAQDASFGRNQWNSPDSILPGPDRRPSQDKHSHSMSPVNSMPVTPREQRSQSQDHSKPPIKDEGPPYCIEPRVDSSIPDGHIKVLGRTVYVGGVNALVTTENLRSLFETVGRVQTVTLNYDKFNAFVKMYTHQEAQEVREKLNRASIDSAMIKVAWGCGFGPKNVFDYNTGTSVIPMNKLSHSDQSAVRNSQRGGGPLESQILMEEPDLPISLKGDSSTGTPGFKDGAPPTSVGRGRGRGRGASTRRESPSNLPSMMNMPNMMFPMGMPYAMPGAKGDGTDDASNRMFPMGMPPFPIPGLTAQADGTSSGEQTMPMFPMGMPALPPGMDPSAFGFPFGFPGMSPMGQSEVGDKRSIDDQDTASKKKSRH